MEKQPQAKSSQVQLYVRSAKRPKQPDCGKSSHNQKVAKLRESSHSSQVQLYARSANRPKQPDCGKSSHNQKVDKQLGKSSHSSQVYLQEVQSGQVSGLQKKQPQSKSSQVMKSSHNSKSSQEIKKQPHFKKQPIYEKVAKVLSQIMKYQPINFKLAQKHHHAP